jgi:hypothetical protein
LKKKGQLAVYLLKKERKCGAFVHTQAKETWLPPFIKEQ